MMAKKTDLRVQKTYNALSAAFIELLGEKSFEDITVQELCERAVIRRPTFYLHFSDKYDFFAFFIRSIEQKFLYKLYLENQCASLHERMIGMTQQTILFLEDHQQIIDSCIQSAMLPTLVQILSEEIQEGILAQIRKEENLTVSAEILAAYHTGGIVQIIYYWLLHRNTVTKDELLQEMKKLFYIVCPDKP